VVPAAYELNGSMNASHGSPATVYPSSTGSGYGSTSGASAAAGNYPSTGGNYASPTSSPMPNTSWQ
jgi:hypothetical protein